MFMVGFWILFILLLLHSIQDCSTFQSFTELRVAENQTIIVLFLWLSCNTIRRQQLWGSHSLSRSIPTFPLEQLRHRSYVIHFVHNQNRCLIRLLDNTFTQHYICPTLYLIPKNKLIFSRFYLNHTIYLLYYTV